MTTGLTKSASTFARVIAPAVVGVSCILGLQSCTALHSVGQWLEEARVEPGSSTPAAAPGQRYVAVNTYDVTLIYFKLNNVSAYECTNENAPHIYYGFTVMGTEVAGRDRGNTITMSNGANSPGLMSAPRRVTVAKEGELLQINAWIKDADTGGAVFDGDDAVADWRLSWDDAQIASAKRDANGVIHAGIGLRNNKCGVSFWFKIDKVV